MKNWINKHLKKNTSIKVYVVHEDKRMTVHYIIPNGDQITIGNRSYIITSEEVLLSKGRPAFFYHYDNPNPINPFELATPGMTAKEFNTAITANVAKQIFDASDNSLDMAKVSMFISVVTLIGVVIVGYLMFDNFETLSNALKEIRELLRVIGGI